MWRGDKHAVNVVFYRAYDDGAGTRFIVDQAAVLTDWIPISPNPPSAEKSALDYAALRTTANSDAGKFVLSQDGSFTAVSMMGKYMYKQDSTKLAQVGGTYLAAPTEFGTGASGGAWFAPDNSIVSVVSAQIMQGKTLAMTGTALSRENRVHFSLNCSMGWVSRSSVLGGPCFVFTALRGRPSPVRRHRSRVRRDRNHRSP
ncbi:hypothetical protein GCM10007881_28480 [Mesorhizobium huakuii]|uniref:hypothetical protein n=1 Tax=Mesorhizobium huakuii TaxID=28104 RepID=UPI00235D2FA2|nr:hypothetical protein [Mesorhizobium huakuii]GLQ79330.1 hypothetical protein GCM10007881_28480 [Mesorhizobium huakuii]